MVSIVNPAPWNVVLVLAWMLLPGLLLAKVLTPGRPLLARIVLAPLLTFVGFACLSPLAYAARLDPVLVALLTVALAACIWLVLKQHAPGKDAPTTRPPDTVGMWGVVAVLALGAAVLMGLLGASLPRVSDAWFHVARVRGMMARGQATNTDPFFPGFTDVRYAFSAWHAFLAATGRLLGLPASSAPRFWSVLPAVIAPVAVVLHVVAARALLGRAWHGLLAGALWLVLYLVLGYDLASGFGDGTILPYPGAVCIHLLIPLAILLIAEALTSQRRDPSLWRTRAMLAMVALATALTHIFYGLVLFGMMGLALIAHTLTTRDTASLRKGLRELGLPALAVVGVALLRLPQLAAAPLNGFFEAARTHDPMLGMVDGLIWLQPRAAGRIGLVTFHPVGWVAVAGSLILTVWHRQRFLSVFLALLMVGTLALLCFPPAATVLARVITPHKLPKVVPALPCVLTLTALAAAALTALRDMHGMRRIGGGAVLSLLFAALVHELPARLAAMPFRQRHIERAWIARHEVLAAVMTPLREDAPVVMAPPAESLRLPAYGDCRPVAIPAPYAGPNIPIADALGDVRMFYASDTPMEARLDILERHDVTYALIPTGHLPEYGVMGHGGRITVLDRYILWCRFPGIAIEGRQGIW